MYNNSYAPSQDQRNDRNNSDKSGLTVVVNDDFERALRVFKRKVGQSGILKELKHKRHFEKPSIRLKNKRAEAEKKRRKYGF